MNVRLNKPGTYYFEAQRALKVLFVDDDPILREFAQVHLPAEEVEVSVAEDGLDALTQLEKSPADLIVLDLEMPRMDGFETLRQLRADESTARIPVVVCTSREDIGAIDKAFEAGATAFLVKPINWRLVGHQIRYVHRNTANEAALLEDRARMAGEAREARNALRRVAEAGRRFLTAALKRDPDLRTEAGEFARAIEESL